MNSHPLPCRPLTVRPFVVPGPPKQIFSKLAEGRMPSVPELISPMQVRGVGGWEMQVQRLHTWK